jgi:signal transduction histidine kinase
VAVADGGLTDGAQIPERWLQAVRRISTGTLTGESSVDQLLEMVAISARDLIGADMATILSTTGPDGRVVPRVTSVCGDEAPPDPPSESCLPEAALQGRATVVCDEDMVGAAGRAKGIGASMFVPLRGEAKTLGVLVVANRLGRPAFRCCSTALVEALADQASIVIEFALARERLAWLNVVEERERIARELHDGMIQSLFAVSLQLQATASHADLSTRGPIEDAVLEIDRSVRDLRAYIFGLHPVVSGNGHLTEAVEGLAGSFTRDSDLAVHCEIDQTVAADLMPLWTDLVQVVREAVSNVRRHARARNCWIVLTPSDRGTTLTIRDDGTGFDLSTPRDGRGLKNMRDRVQLLGGDLEVESEPGSGTTLRFLLPPTARARVVPTVLPGAPDQ